MKEFMLLFRNLSPHEAYSSSPEEMQEILPKWQKWMKELADDDVIVATAPLGKDGMYIANDTVTDGPYAEIKESVMGYLIVKAADVNAAVEIGKGCPILEDGGGSVEVRAIQHFEA